MHRPPGHLVATPSRLTRARSVVVAAGLLALLAACRDSGAPPPEPEPAAAPAPPPPPTPMIDPTKLPRQTRPLPPPDKPARRFLSVAGQVTVDGQPAFVGAPISATAAIETGKDGHAVITVEPDSVVEIRSETRLLFGSSARKRTSVKLLGGALWSFLPEGASYEVVTPNAIAGVRGTVFYVEVPKADESYICACSGKVELHSLDKRGFKKDVSSPANNHKAYIAAGRGKKSRLKAAQRRNHTEEQADANMGLLPQTQ